MTKSNPLWVNLSIYGLMLGTCLVLYGNVLNAEFVYDDAVFRDDPMLHVSSLGQTLDILFSSEAWRRVGQVTFAINFFLGGLNPYGYHLFNILIHSLTGFLLFSVTLKILSLPPFREKWKDSAKAIALMGTMIWLVHPLQIMAVTYTVQRFASLAALFFLLSFFSYLNARVKHGRKSLLWYGLSLFCALLAFGSKENSVVLPLVILLFEILFFSRQPIRQNKRKLIIWASVIGAFLLFMTLVYMGPNIKSQIMNNSIGKGWHPYERLITQFRVIILYITLLIWPDPSRLNVDYDFSLSKGLFSPPSTFLSLLLLTAIVLFAFYRARKNPLLSFSILWFFINLSVESSFLPLDLVYEHRLYLPSMGPILLFSGFVCSMKRPHLRKTGIATGILFMMLLAFWTRERNVVWRDSVTLWEDNVAKSPNRARVHGNLGKAYLDAGKYEKARVEFEKTLQLNPTFLGAYNNLATIYIDHYRHYEMARQYLQEAIRRNPNYPSAYLNLGVVHLQLRELEAATRAFRKFLKLEPKNLLGHYNLAAAYFNLKQYAKAILILQRGIDLWSRSDKLYALLGASYFHEKEYENADLALSRALRLNATNGLAAHYMEKIQNRQRLSMAKNKR